MPILYECVTSGSLLAEIAAELLGTTPAAARPQADHLFQKHRGNLREALRDWYDLTAEQSTLRQCLSFELTTGVAPEILGSIESDR